MQEEQRGEDEPPPSDESNESGDAATRGEALVERRFGLADRDESLRRLAREAPVRLPRRRSYRRMRGRRGAMIDLRRTLRDAARNDGEVLKLARLKRRTRPRKILLLIDVSGSMKSRTRGQSAACARPRAGLAAHRSLHLRHPPHPRDAPDASEAPRTGARRRCAAGERLGRRHADRRRVAGLSRRAALRRLCARRSRADRLRRARARRSRWR